ncbi:MAG: hypothetical protein M9895_08970 [Aquamicrobium sp.]|uniref:hypothetical protein n=1 Tax=Aquamicrobium sp. TaxID=1872579 RepID=UPI00349E97A6|nr:hypothetical protein [Aquamicrobium sp.]
MRASTSSPMACICSAGRSRLAKSTSSPLSMLGFHVGRDVGLVMLLPCYGILTAIGHAKAVSIGRDCAAPPDRQHCCASGILSPIQEPWTDENLVIKQSWTLLICVAKFINRCPAVTMA